MNKIVISVTLHKGACISEECHQVTQWVERARESTFTCTRCGGLSDEDGKMSLQWERKKKEAGQNKPVHLHVLMTKACWQGCGMWLGSHASDLLEGRWKWVDACIGAAHSKIWKKNKDVNKHQWPLMWLAACFSISLYDQETSFHASSKIDLRVEFHLKLAHMICAARRSSTFHTHTHNNLSSCVPV